jgi:hypothetical protein
MSSTIPITQTFYVVLVTHCAPGSIPYTALLNFLVTIPLLLLQATRPIRPATIPYALFWTSHSSNSFSSPSITPAPMNPEDTSTLLSYLTYSFMNPLLALGWVKKLDEAEIWPLSLSNRSDATRGDYEACRAEGVATKVFSLNLGVLLGDFGCNMVSILMNYAAPWFLKRVLYVFRLL